MYYYENAGQKNGPLSKEALKGKISKDTLVWREGLENWIKASQLPELKDLFKNEPPPFPSTEPKSTDEIESVNIYALLLFVMLIIMGVMEYFELEKNRIYRFLLPALILATYKVFSRIKRYLNNVLSYTAANKDLIIIIVTSVVLDFADGLLRTPSWERKLLNLPDAQSSMVFILILVLICLHIYYLFSLGKKMSKIEDGVASRISKFAYWSLISFAVIIFISFISDNTTTLMLLSIIEALPLLYLIIGLKNSNKQVGYV
ncbi:DUF4339 domain-containing protein [Algibacter amylolyticus]|uniref:DUF4339 domain-containing protein n=1 Tax=Algibacter amylolyticus TaxID=1608400 RepID=A0A5M7BF15_9FLAO|nr:DUF4339 domain-containing protein [Algibacter amylolyticus]KAA5826254.1 DUF4339 domain-containing protein [Algibacter amylolyticus]MBB5268457.1 preprotein translocase subunit YajC [Algibacter amylolyticus]TSJ80292.1 DUF4339 domain-containing protein [Algibacter amylolyticus]